MGRVKKYAGGQKNRRSKSLVKKRVSGKFENSEMMETDSAAVSSNTTLSVAKRKQIFKKSKEGRREVKKQILELKRQTSKLRKKNLDQKSEKKRISKEIKRLRVSLEVKWLRCLTFEDIQEKMRTCDVEENEDDDGDDANQWEEVADEDDDKNQ